VPAQKIGVINVSGGLVNRPMPGPSGGGPISYVAIRESFEALLQDDEIAAIVLHLESPGGMCSGCFDLVDYLYQARGKKPVHALVNDYAFSAAYAIASACDRIWVSRTGEVGSIGVVAFHYDWSGANAQFGVKVTPIYAGAHKIDFNPNFALSDEAKSRAQADIDGIYELFVTTVARNRGMTAEAVRQTEALTFQGAAAIDAGLATDLGTWDDMVASMGLDAATAPASAGGQDADGEATASAVAVSEGGSGGEEPSAEDAPPAPADPVEEAGDTPPPEAFADVVAASDLAPAIALALIRRGAAGASAGDAIAYARSVQGLCAAAGLESVAADYVKANTSIEIVRTQLIDAKAAGGPEIVTSLPATGAAKQGVAKDDPLNPTTIYQKRGN
jgi:signal peptide peptidase SppA